MGFDGLFFARIDYDDRKKRINDTSMEFVWQAAHDKGENQGGGGGHRGHVPHRMPGAIEPAFKRFFLIFFLQKNVLSYF